MPPTDEPTPPEEAVTVLDAEAQPDAPPADVFWKSYNAHYEFPTGTALSILAHLLIAFGLVLALTVIRGKGDSKPVNITNIGGDDDTGAGSPGAGDPNPIDAGNPPTEEDLKREQLPQDLAQVREDITKNLDLDPSQIPDSAIAALAALDEELRDKITNIGKRKGDGQAGTGIGGTGSDSTRARGMRWVLKFNTKNGQDYLAQLRAMKAVVMIPVPPENKRLLILRDLGRPRIDEFASDYDISQQTNKIQFSDIRRDSCQVMQQVLNLNFTPASIIAFFPKELEETMSRLEMSYQNKKTEEIKETVFQVQVVGGEARLKVHSQSLKGR